MTTFCSSEKKKKKNSNSLTSPREATEGWRNCEWRPSLAPSVWVCVASQISWTHLTENLEDGLESIKRFIEGVLSGMVPTICALRGAIFTTTGNRMCLLPAANGLSRVDSGRCSIVWALGVHRGSLAVEIG
jgi:hypothetical protein